MSNYQTAKLFDNIINNPQKEFRMEEANEIKPEELHNIFLINTMLHLIHQERCNPDIMDFDRKTFPQLCERVKRRQMEVDSYAESGSESRLGEKNFLHSIYQLQVDRIQYLLKTYLRIRLGKIQRYAFYIIKSSAVLTDLSAQEKNYVRAYAKMRFQQYDQIVLKDLHKDFRGLDGVETLFTKATQKKKQQISKQTKVQLKQPNKNKFVFLRILDNPKLMRYNHDIHVSNIKKEDRPLIQAEDVLFVPYSEVEPFFKTKNGQLL